MTLFDAPQRIVTTARVSACGRYRYELQRRWDDGPLLTFVMLNPSTADDRLDDQTIRRCIGYAGREGLSGIRVVNLFAARATIPADLVDMAGAGCDPRGPENTAAIHNAIKAATAIVFAWGSSIPRPLRRLADTQIAYVEHLCLTYGLTPLCLGKTGDGSPRHPSRGAYRPFEAWR